MSDAYVLGRLDMGRARHVTEWGECECPGCALVGVCTMWLLPGDVIKCECNMARVRRLAAWTASSPRRGCQSQPRLQLPTDARVWPLERGGALVSIYNLILYLHVKTNLIWGGFVVPRGSPEGVVISRLRP